MNKVLDIYKRQLTSHPFITVTFFLFYLLLTLQFIFKVNLIEKWRMLWKGDEIKVMQEQRISELQSKVEQQDKIIEVLTKREREYSFLRKLEFQEDWKAEDNRNNVLRILDYADFAIQKQDYSRAEQLYLEADKIQETLTVPYYRGRLAYIQGNLPAAESQWKRVISLDRQGRYPEVRLYLAIALYEIGKGSESKAFLKEYLDSQ